MGKYKFRLSDMIPNAWFHKLKDMSHHTGSSSSSSSSSRKQKSLGQATSRLKRSHSPRTSFSSSSYSYISSSFTSSSSSSSRTVLSKPAYSPPPHPKLLSNRASCYISSRFPPPKHNEPPRTSKKRSRGKPMIVKPTSSPPTTATATTAEAAAKLVTSSIYASCRCKEWKTEPIPVSPYPPDSDVDSGSCDVVTASATDIIIDMPSATTTTKATSLADGAAPKLELPPILTKLSKKEADCNNNNNAASPAKFKRSQPPRFNLRATNSPRLASKKVQAALGSDYSSSRRSTSNAPKTATPPVPARTTTTTKTAAGGKKQIMAKKGRVTSESLAVVKSSSDPRRDFRESMVEMIVENGICSSKDLEDLLACYLALNSDEYHDLIVEVFEQIWLDLTHIKLASCKY